ncbi:hypothetical protein MES5069_360112 [Mesorhizobium escarrei]|uniref:Uncharacterized protein n=1 Tax=Mesorhizobium escarrei TaxID=666018 RepID=A0ABM9E1P9_9HYPH|nr:hypothetical protein MES5069_360112 [Mesorhizobium escarrei]
MKLNREVGTICDINATVHDAIAARRNPLGYFKVPPGKRDELVIDFNELARLYLTIPGEEDSHDLGTPGRRATSGPPTGICDLIASGVFRPLQHAVRCLMFAHGSVTARANV